MENLNLPPFYPGQKVVSLKYSKQVNCKKGDILTVVKCIKSPCTCGSGWDVAIKEFIAPKDFSKCVKCGVKVEHTGLFYYVGDAKNFAPLEEKFEHISLSKVIKIETCLVSEN